MERMKWVIERKEESKQEYKEMQCKGKRVVAKPQQTAYDELCERMDTKREKRICILWRDRTIKLERMCSRLG